MRISDLQLAETFTRHGVVPPWNWLEGALDKVVKQAERDFTTQFKRDMIQHMNYAWMNSGRFGGGGWGLDQQGSPLSYDLIAGVRNYEQDIPLEEAMLNSPEMSVYLANPRLSFRGSSDSGIGTDMKYSLLLKCQEIADNALLHLKEFLQREKRTPIIIIPDLQDKEIFSFVLPRDVGEGYTHFRLRQYIGENNKL